MKYMNIIIKCTKYVAKGVAFIFPIIQFILKFFKSNGIHKDSYRIINDGFYFKTSYNVEITVLMDLIDIIMISFLFYYSALKYISDFKALPIITVVVGYILLLLILLIGGYYELSNRRRFYN